MPAELGSTPESAADSQESTLPAGETSRRPSEGIDSESSFSLASLMVLITVAAFALSAVHYFGWIASVGLFLAAVFATLIVYPRLAKDQLPRQMLFFDLVWGLLMPLVCFALDPIVFREGTSFDEMDLLSNSNGNLKSIAFLAYPVVGLQMALLLAWLGLRPKSPLIKRMFEGSFLMGALIALVTAVLIFPVAFIGVAFFGLGLPGFTPIFTAYVFARRAKDAADGQKSTNGVLPIAFGLLALIAPVCAGAFALGLVRGWENVF
jgi:hypothetical protein